MERQVASIDGVSMLRIFLFTDQPMAKLTEEANSLQNRIWDREGPLEQNIKDQKMKAYLAEIRNKGELRNSSKPICTWRPTYRTVHCRIIASSIPATLST